LQVKISLISTSTDGKILVWKYTDKLKFPIKGHLLATRKGNETMIVGGTSMDKVVSAEDNTYIVGTEGGSVYKCNIVPPTDQDFPGFVEDNPAVRWKQEAADILANLPPKVVPEVKKKVERYIQDKGEKDVTAASVFHAKPDIKMLFPAPFTSNFEKHMGPVSGVSCSPFVKRLFLTCSSDGTIRMYDVLSNRPVATFETGHNEYL
jgi:WD40 repeat protein